MDTTKKLYRSRSNRQIAGVCGGIAEYFDLDPSIVRLAFLAVTLFGGPGLILYIVLAVVVPEEPFNYYGDKPKREDVIPDEDEVS
ncbi:MAG: PspC domain-containing protein [Anaerolineae bacterium]|nr:PspC domain-containing protein [Anaerolineae bacterium]